MSELYRETIDLNVINSRVPYTMAASSLFQSCLGCTE